MLFKCSSDNQILQSMQTLTECTSMCYMYVCVINLCAMSLGKKP